LSVGEATGGCRSKNSRLGIRIFAADGVLIVVFVLEFGFGEGKAVVAGAEGSGWFGTADVVEGIIVGLGRRYRCVCHVGCSSGLCIVVMSRGRIWLSRCQIRFRG
jgi:hypothetical protein